MENDHKGYSLFKDVDNIRLAAFNRANVVLNMVEQNLRATAESYLAMFNMEERVVIYLMLGQIKSKGSEEVGKGIRSTVNFDNKFYGQVVNG